jgi:hypothetical protein
VAREPWPGTTRRSVGEDAVRLEGKLDEPGRGRHRHVEPAERSGVHTPGLARHPGQVEAGAARREGVDVLAKAARPDPVPGVERRGTEDPDRVADQEEVDGVAGFLGRPGNEKAERDAMLAGMGAGLVATDARWNAPGETLRPDARARARYDELYRVYRSLYPATREQAHALARVQEDTANAALGR